MMTEYRWQWMRPDKPGAWAYAGSEVEIAGDYMCVVNIADINSKQHGWWCFLMDMPTILPPKKKTVWRMWVVPYCPAQSHPTSYAPFWRREGVTPSETGAIRTDKTEEREE